MKFFERFLHPKREKKTPQKEEPTPVFDFPEMHICGTIVRIADVVYIEYEETELDPDSGFRTYIRHLYGTVATLRAIGDKNGLKGLFIRPENGGEVRFFFAYIKKYSVKNTR